MSLQRQSEPLLHYLAVYDDTYILNVIGRYLTDVVTFTQCKNHLDQLWYLDENR